METLLAPYLSDAIEPARSELLLKYLGLLVKWNARTNLTAIRSEEEIVQRHFGESLALAELLSREFQPKGRNLFDLGSGAGFPGVPIAILRPELQVTLIESQTKKTTFLKELIRVLEIKNCEIYANRAENLAKRADFVTMRAVDHTKSMLPVAHSLLVPRGTLALMISPEQRHTLDGFGFSSVRHLQAANGVHVLLGTALD